MATFDFITTEDLRDSLSRDALEMAQCFEVEAWKAVHVLAGSIVEAVLIDYIVAEGLMPIDDALKLDLGKAIVLCKDRGGVSERTVDLSSVIRGYRNLIHPGRIVRLREDVNRDSAEVAKAVVRLVVAEIEKQRSNSYGYTAEQILGKIQRDPSVDTIISRLLKGTPAVQIRRLLLNLLPNVCEHFLESAEETCEVPTSYALCFRTAFDLADIELKKACAASFVKVLKEGSNLTILARAQLFRASDLQYLAPDDIDLVKNYLLGRLEEDSGVWLATSRGVGAHIVSSEIEDFVDPLVRMITAQQSNRSKAAIKLLQDESSRMSTELNQSILNRLNAWISAYHSENLVTHSDKIEQVKASIAGNAIPF